MSKLYRQEPYLVTQTFSSWGRSVSVPGSPSSTIRTVLYYSSPRHFFLRYYSQTILLLDCIMIVQALSKCSFDRKNIQFRFMLSYIEYNNAFFPPVTVWKNCLVMMQIMNCLKTFISITFPFLAAYQFPGSFFLSSMASALWQSAAMVCFVQLFSFSSCSCLWLSLLLSVNGKWTNYWGSPCLLFTLCSWSSVWC